MDNCLLPLVIVCYFYCSTNLGISDRLFLWSFLKGTEVRGADLLPSAMYKQPGVCLTFWIILPGTWCDPWEILCSARSWTWGSLWSFQLSIFWFCKMLLTTKTKLNEKKYIYSGTTVSTRYHLNSKDTETERQGDFKQGILDCIFK